VVSITVGKQPTQEPVYGPPRPVVNRAREAQDAMRRPQAAVLFRALKSAGESGLSWKECWALSDDEEFVVGPIVIWMRFHGCDIEARYDVVAGETRFYLMS
jgi:hypothetical protein